jgi:hypothetical protein
MTIEAFIDHLFKKCAERGILVMLVMHRQQASDELPPLWYSAGYDEERFIAAWKTLVTRYQSHWNFFACDLKNEPHGAASWGDGGKTDWCAAAGRIGNAILALCPRMLIFVEGNDGQGMDISWWGGYLGLAGPDKHPVRLSVPNRLVYSPHVYGPDVDDKKVAFHEASFPGNMQVFWRRWVDRPSWPPGNVKHNTALVFFALHQATSICPAKRPHESMDTCYPQSQLTSVSQVLGTLHVVHAAIERCCDLARPLLSSSQESQHIIALSPKVPDR